MCVCSPVASVLVSLIVLFHVHTLTAFWLANQSYSRQLWFLHAVTVIGESAYYTIACSTLFTPSQRYLLVNVHPIAKRQIVSLISKLAVFPIPVQGVMRLVYLVSSMCDCPPVASVLLSLIVPFYFRSWQHKSRLYSSTLDIAHYDSHWMASVLYQSRHDNVRTQHSGSYSRQLPHSNETLWNCAPTIMVQIVNYFCVEKAFKLCLEMHLFLV